MREGGRCCGGCVFCTERPGALRTATVCAAPSRGGTKVAAADPACEDFVPVSAGAAQSFFGLASWASPSRTAGDVGGPRRLACDAHTHTLFSRHAYSTIEENVRAAAAAGLELLGSTDHFSRMLFPDDDLRNFQFFLNQACWPRRWHGVLVLRGCEADIVDLEGHLFGWDVPVATDIVGKPSAGETTLLGRVLCNLDYVIASVHGSSFAEGVSLARTTEMYVAALSHPKVAILGHPGRAGVPFDVEEVVREAGRLGKMVEINDHSLGGGNARHSHGPCREIAECCAENGVRVAVNSDAHLACGIGRLDNALALLEEIRFPRELVATRSAKAFLGTLRAAGVCDVRAQGPA